MHTRSGHHRRCSRLATLPRPMRIESFRHRHHLESSWSSIQYPMMVTPRIKGGVRRGVDEQQDKELKGETCLSSLMLHMVAATRSLADHDRRRKEVVPSSNRSYMFHIRYPRLSSAFPLASPRPFPPPHAFPPFLPLESKGQSGGTKHVSAGIHPGKKDGVTTMIHEAQRVTCTFPGNLRLPLARGGGPGHPVIRLYL